MDLTEKSTFATINNEIKVILAELDEVVALKENLLKSEDIEKNNEIFLEILDQLSGLIRSEETNKNNDVFLEILDKFVGGE